MRWTKPCKALELGAGSGKTSILLYKNGYEVTCLDNDPDVIKLLKSNFKKYDAKCKTLTKDIANITGKYDLIFSCGVLEHLETKKIINTYKAIYEHLNPEGFSIQIVPSKNFIYQTALSYRIRKLGKTNIDDKHAFETMKPFHPNGLKLIKEYKTGLLHSFHTIGWFPLLAKPIFNIEKIIPYKNLINRLPGTWLVSIAKKYENINSSK